MTPEGWIKKSVREYLEKTGWFVFNIAQFNKKGYKVHSGISDLIAIKNGKVWFLEVKTPTGETKPSQIEFSNKVVSHGGNYAIVRCVEDAMSIKGG